MKANILVLGIDGMLGSMLGQVLAQNSSFFVIGSSRNPSLSRSVVSRLIKIEHLDADDPVDSLKRLKTKYKPAAVINCIGLISQKYPGERSAQRLAFLKINALFPHLIAQVFGDSTRIISMSSDCVFGDNKNFEIFEGEPCAPNDIYGASKYLGEITDRNLNSLCIRTSIVGPELGSCYALFDWFRRGKGEVKGYVNAYFSGLTTLELSRVIEKYCLNDQLKGVYHVAGPIITKYDFLCLVRDKFKVERDIVPFELKQPIRRCLNCEKFTDATGYESRAWASQLEELLEVVEAFDAWRDHE